jgi:hypothetical protein
MGPDAAPALGRLVQQQPTAVEMDLRKNGGKNTFTLLSLSLD